MNRPKQENFSSRKGEISPDPQASDPPEIVHSEKLASLEPLSGFVAQRLPNGQAHPPVMEHGGMAVRGSAERADF
jgi:hypothetical protein